MMVKKIKPTNDEDEYVLEDKDYLLIEAIRSLTAQLNRLNNLS